MPPHPVPDLRVLDGSALRVRCQRQDEHPSAGLGGQVQGGTQRLESEVGIQGHGVGGQGRAVPQPGVRIGGHGGPDVTPLRIGDRHDPAVSCGSQQAFKGGQPGRPVTFEQRDLGFEDASCLPHRFKDCHSEPLAPGGVVGQSPGGEQRRVRIDPHA